MSFVFDFLNFTVLKLLHIYILWNQHMSRMIVKTSSWFHKIDMWITYFRLMSKSNNLGNIDKTVNMFSIVLVFPRNIWLRTTRCFPINLFHWLILLIVLLCKQSINSIKKLQKKKGLPAKSRIFSVNRDDFWSSIFFASVVGVVCC
jgi:hypothetical protein